MNGLTKLQELKLEQKRQQYPSLPSHAIPKPKFSDKTANGLTSAIIEYIRLIGGQAERISVEGRVLDTRKTYRDVLGQRRTIGTVQRVRSSAQVGSADVSSTINGRSVKIEIKVGRDRQSPMQKAYQQQVEQAGGIYLLISSFQDFSGKELQE